MLEALLRTAVQGMTGAGVSGRIGAVIAQGSVRDDANRPKSAFESINLRKRPVRARTGRRIPHRALTP